MKAVIIDDESNVRETTRKLLEAFVPGIIILGEADGVVEGEKLIEKVNPDLIFLDIEMTDGTGFDLLNRFPKRSFKVIFITGHNDYAIKAFKFSALDYILKPVDPDDLVRATEKVFKESDQRTSGIQQEALAENLSNKEYKKLVLRDQDSVYLVTIEEIVQCTADGNYTHFFLIDGRKITISTTLKEYEALLTPSNFFRCHQSHLINLRYFERLDKREGGIIHLKNGGMAPLATRKKEQLLERLAGM